MLGELKLLIDQLDQRTKATMKDSLYRISRHAQVPRCPANYPRATLPDISLVTLHVLLCLRCSHTQELRSLGTALSSRPSARVDGVVTRGSTLGFASGGLNWPLCNRAHRRRFSRQQSRRARGRLQTAAPRTTSVQWTAWSPTCCTRATRRRCRLLRPPWPCSRCSAQCLARYTWCRSGPRARIRRAHRWRRGTGRSAGAWYLVVRQRSGE